MTPLSYNLALYIIKRGTACKSELEMITLAKGLISELDKSVFTYETETGINVPDCIDEYLAKANGA